MAIDIILANSGNPIQNGSCIVTCSNVGQYSVLDTYAATTPAISDIQSKYDNRFDDPSYYYGDGTQGS